MNRFHFFVPDDEDYFGTVLGLRQALRPSPFFAQRSGLHQYDLVYKQPRALLLDARARVHLPDRFVVSVGLITDSEYMVGSGELLRMMSNDFLLRCGFTCESAGVYSLNVGNRSDLEEAVLIHHFAPYRCSRIFRTHAQKL